MKIVGVKLFQLMPKDFIKGAIMAILASFLTAAYTMLQAGAIPTDFASWKPTLITAVGAGVGYVLKNWLSNSDGDFLKKEPIADAKP